MTSSEKTTKARTAQQINRAAFVLREYMTPEERSEIDRLIFSPAKEVERYRKDPVAFCKEVLQVEPAFYQAQIFEQFIKHKRLCVRGPHGMGKTAMSAMVVLWFVAVHEECKILTTASAWRQLTEFLWPEIHKYAVRANWWRVGLQVRVGKELLGHKLEISKTRFATALSSTDEAKIEGGHAPNILYLFDEAKTIPPAIWDAAEGAMSSGNAYAFACSTPGDSSGRFYEIQMRKYDHWSVYHVTFKQAIAAGRITQKWADDMLRQWGEESVLYKRRVLGQFAEDTAETVITLSMVERANEIWREMMDRVKELVESGISQEDADRLVWGELTHLGVDPARFGDDQTGYFYRYGEHGKEIRRTVKEDTMETAGRTASALENNDAIANIDINGLGAGVFDRLMERWKKQRNWRTDDKRCPAIPYNASSGTKVRDKSGQLQFNRMRDMLWWKLRERLEEGNVALPPDDQLTADLVAFKYGYTSSGKILIEEKKEVKKRLGRSPDSGDACVLAFAPDGQSYRVLMGFV